MKNNIDKLNRMIHYERELEYQKQVDGSDFEKEMYIEMDKQYKESLENVFNYRRTGMVRQTTIDKYGLNLRDEDNINLTTGRFPDSFQETYVYEGYLMKQLQDIHSEHGDLNEDIVNNTLALRVEILYQMYMFYRSGKRVYRFYDDFVEVLDNIKDDWKKTTGSLIRLPHKSIYIPLPPSLGIKNEIRGRVCGTYITWLDRGKGRTEYKFLVAYEAKSWEDMEKEYSTNLSIMIDDDMTIQDAMGIWGAKGWGVKDDEDFSQSMNRMLESVFKLLIYISSVNADVKIKYGSKKISISDRKIRRNIGKLPSSLPSYIVGGAIKIKPIGESKIYNKGGGVKHRYKHMVRGHFHSFWMNRRPDIDESKIVKYGEQWTRQENKVLVRKFVEPYWKGKDLADIVLKDYIVEG